MIGIDRALGQRRDVALAIRIGAGFEQEIDHVGVPLDGGPHQRRRLLHRVGGVQIDGPFEQQRDGRDAAGARGGSERGFSGRHPASGIRARLEQRGHHLRVTDAAGRQQRRDTEVVGSVDLRASANEHARDLDVGVVSSPEQRRRAVAGTDVHVGA